ncbi:MAG: polyphosphate polymerase domain-containing protein [Oligoflexia bacterium]|nr:polyphosphate polymerase domain-containing protein [Oligoflexia bacterium]
MQLAYRQQEYHETSDPILKEEHFFDRIEDKYVMNNEMLEPLLKKIDQRMLPSYNGNDVKYTLIESIYFDSLSLELYQHHLQDLPVRYKIRVRKYGPGGAWDNETLFWEIKTKELGKSKKVRFKINKDDLMLLTRGLPMKYSSDLLEMNANLGEEKLRKRLAKTQEVYNKLSPIPSMKIRYLRHAFELGETRVTIDNNIYSTYLLPRIKQKLRLNSNKEGAIINGEVFENKIIEMLDKFHRKDIVVMEVKYQGALPDWFNDILYEFELIKTSFSKYFYFISRVMLPR